MKAIHSGCSCSSEANRSGSGDSCRACASTSASSSSASSSSTGHGSPTAKCCKTETTSRHNTNSDQAPLPPLEPTGYGFQSLIIKLDHLSLSVHD